MRYLLDTNTVIGVLRARNIGLLARYAAIPRASICTCSIVKAELFYGALKSAKPAQNRAAQEAFLRGLASFNFDDLAVEHYARIRSEIEHDGKPIGCMDLLIAPIALANQVVLVTHNLREFSRVRGLLLEDWETP
ncbi:type II toxin-antitoxin system VapC family toxin [Sorangium sp. So ce131]|uniref:type II toxin-antitoxin system VapC family toxin n=1 Tax=Sorangium sp. So ce131 TaxID=3133282 RepID=UPI003F62AE07